MIKNSCLDCSHNGLLYQHESQDKEDARCLWLNYLLISKPVWLSVGNPWVSSPMMDVDQPFVNCPAYEKAKNA